VSKTSSYTAAQGLATFQKWTQNEAGMCLKEVRTAQGIPSANSNATGAWESAIGRHHDDTSPPVGAPVFWTGGSGGHGHIAIFDGVNVRSTDAGGSGKMGTKPLSWFASNWGLTYRGWAEGYNGYLVKDLGADSGSDWSSGDVYLDKLRYGQRDSDSVRRLQYTLNETSIPAPGNVTLPITGNYLDQTDEVVRAWQLMIGDTPDPAGASFLGPKQAAALFPASYNLIQ
jgi:hypothetical protein